MSATTDTVRYELMVIVSPDIGETAIKKRIESIKKSIADFGGEVIFEDVWGVKDMAYDIKKHDQGYYVVLDVNMNPTQLKDLDRMLRLEVEVLRHLMMKLPTYYQPKTFIEMEAEAAKQKEEEAKEEGKDKKPARMAMPVKKAEAPKEEMKAPAHAPKATEKKTEEEAPKKTPKKKEESKKELEDIDAKLDSILSNPDINF